MRGTEVVRSFFRVRSVQTLEGSGTPGRHPGFTVGMFPRWSLLLRCRVVFCPHNRPYEDRGGEPRVTTPNVSVGSPWSEGDVSKEGRK